MRARVRDVFHALDHDQRLVVRRRGEEQAAHLLRPLGVGLPLSRPTKHDRVRVEAAEPRRLDEGGEALPHVGGHDHLMRVCGKVSGERGEHGDVGRTWSPA